MSKFILMCSCIHCKQELTIQNLNRHHLSKHIENGSYKTLPSIRTSRCIICNTQIHNAQKTCSAKCRTKSLQIYGSKGGKISAAKSNKRSKYEIELFDLCQSYFSNVEHNKPLFNGWDADIIIHDKKLAILWNGPWHYQQMPLSNHSLKQVQNRDKIKIDEIVKFGYIPIIFEDRHYTPISAFNYIINL